MVRASPNFGHDPGSGHKLSRAIFFKHLVMGSPRVVQPIGSVQTKINIYIKVLFDLSNYKLNKL
jgi:hypothetical protein